MFSRVHHSEGMEGKWGPETSEFNSLPPTHTFDPRPRRWKRVVVGRGRRGFKWENCNPKYANYNLESRVFARSLAFAHSAWDQGCSKLKFQFRKIRKSKRAVRSKSKTENRNSKTPKISKISKSKSKIQKFHFNAKIYS
jgi:hypothetical protein